MNRPIIIIVILLIVLVLGIILIWPKYQSLDFLRTNIEEKEVELQYKEEYFSQLQDISEKLKDYEENFSKISNALPLDSSIPSLFNFLQKTSSGAGLILEDITLQGIIDNVAIKELENESEVSTKGIKEIRVNLSLSGSYSAFKDFLQVLESSARLIEVKNISFSSPLESREPFSFGVNIITHSY